MMLLLAGQAWAAKGYGVVKCGDDFRVLTGKPPLLEIGVDSGNLRNFSFRFDPGQYGLSGQVQVLFAKFLFDTPQGTHVVVVPRGKQISYDAYSPKLKYLRVYKDLGWPAVLSLEASVVATNGRCTAEVFFDIEFGPME